MDGYRFGQRHAVPKPGDHKGRPYSGNVGGRRLCPPRRYAIQFVLSCSATLATPALAQASSLVWLDPLTPTAPMVSLPTLIGTPPPSAITSASWRCAARSAPSLVCCAHSSDGRRNVRAV